MPSISDPGSRVVRVFISSTFRDFEQERNLLAKEVFPELRRRARERFVEVMEVDLRWGITQEQSEQGLTLPICLREIERARPYFIGLLGERYGWTPTPGQYSELLLDQHAWLKEHMGGTSVTELEILHGVLRDPAMAGRAYFYFRDPAYSADKGPDFRSEGAIERAKLDELKSKIRSSGFPVVEYATPHAVAQQIIDDLWSRIDEQYPADEVPDELERERRSHESYAAERRRVFVGQEATVAALLGRLESAAAATRLTVVTGESGTGKSALLANVLEQYRAKHPHDQVIEHYLAAGYGAADPAKILRRLAAEIKRFTGTLKEIEASDDLLMQQLAEWLAEASAWAQQAGCSVIIALDGLDKLDGSRALAWLPWQMPPNVRVVVSTLAGESLDALRKRGEVELAAQPFSIESARSYVIEALEKRRGKHLPAREIERIIAHPRATLPIFLKTLVDELSMYGSFEGLPGRISQCLAAAEPDDLFEVILARLEDDMGRDSVQKPLEAIWAAPGGLSDAELVGFTGVTPLELARLKLALGDALHEDRGMVMPAHDYLRKGIKDRYLESDELVSELHHRLGAWWERQQFSHRTGEIAKHYLLARAWDDLERCLTCKEIGSELVHVLSTGLYMTLWRELAANGSRRLDGMASRLMDQMNAWLSETSDLSKLKLLLSLVPICLVDNGKFDSARALAQYKLTVSLEQVGELSTPDAVREVGLSISILGRIALAQNDLEAARTYYIDALRVATSEAAVTRDTQLPKIISDAHCDVAEIELKCGNLESAEEHFRASIATLQPLISPHRPVQLMRRYGKSLEGLARTMSEAGHLDQALLYCEESHEVLELALAAATTHDEQNQTYSVLKSLHYYTGRIEHKRGNLQRARNHFTSSLELVHLLKHSGAQASAILIADQCELLRGLGYLALDEQRTDSALDYFQQLYELVVSAAPTATSLTSRSDRCEALLLIASMQAKLSRFSEAVASFELALDELLKPTPIDGWSQVPILESLCDIAAEHCQTQVALMWVDRYAEALIADGAIPTQAAAYRLEVELRGTSFDAIHSAFERVMPMLPIEVRLWSQPLIAAVLAQRLSTRESEAAQALVKFALEAYPGALIHARSASSITAAGMALVTFSACPRTIIGSNAPFSMPGARKVLGTALKTIESTSPEEWIAAGLPPDREKWIQAARLVLENW